MGDSVQVVSLTDEQRAAAEQQRQALEAARLAAEAQVQREQLERRRREEERLRERNLAAQRAAQACPSRVAGAVALALPLTQLVFCLWRHGQTVACTDHPCACTRACPVG